MTTGGAIPGALDRIRLGLAPVSRELEAAGMPVPEWAGKLIRPLVGFAGAGPRAMEAGADVKSGPSVRPGAHVVPGADVEAGAGDRPAPFWRALAAVQLAHEASLLHDDVVDAASTRRGRPTLAASRGVAAALVEGDHLLTAAYRLAARTGSLEWAGLFAEAVERTVAGEKEQARRAGETLDWTAYEGIVLGKSGELLGAALAAGPMLRNEWGAHRWYEVGRRVGLVYQMLDDLLDYCPHVETGKPALSDYRRGLWTWPRAHIDLPAGLDPAAVADRLRTPSLRAGLAAALERFRAEVEDVASRVAELMPGDELVTELLAEWLRRAEDAVASGAAELPPVAGWEQLMAEHAKSFRFASRLFPADRRAQITGVYAWCRYTDDLVDGIDLPPRDLEARLDAWLALSRRAYGGERTGNELADRVMTDMRQAGVPFGYAEALIEGMRMDVRGTGYATLTELWTYTYRVASVVGLWMTELFGIRDPWMLDRAASLGHAMQLTNILRDVGEDLAAGRLYLPTAWLAAHDLDRADLERMARTGAVDDAYRELVERLLRVAEAEYAHAAPAIDRLPDFYRRPVAVAADVYRGIHDAIRANGYDNLGHRAYTTLFDKVRLGAGALIRSRDRGTPSWRTALIRAAALGLALLLPGAAGAQQQPAGPFLDLDRVVRPVSAPAGASDRETAGIADLWVLAVDAEAAVDAGLEAIAAARSGSGPADPSRDRLLRAYEGAFLALRAKHGGWPPARLRNLRSGFALMDAAVDEAPDDVRVRYIRLMSGFYLPGIFGRGDEVDADLAALARLLPGSSDEIPAAALPEVVAFVLEHGDPTPADRTRLEALLP